MFALIRRNLGKFVLISLFFFLVLVYLHFLFIIEMICILGRPHTWLLDILFFIYEVSSSFIHFVHLNHLRNFLISQIIGCTMGFDALINLVLFSFGLFYSSVFMLVDQIMKWGFIWIWIFFFLFRRFCFFPFILMVLKVFLIDFKIKFESHKVLIYNLTL